LQKNLLSHFCKIKKDNPELFNKIIKLPFITSTEKFERTYKEILESNVISKKQIDYLNSKLENKEMWGKCFLKETFLGGVSTTSRVESLHALQKRYLTSNASLQKVFHSFRLIEKIQVSKFEEENQKEKKSFQLKK